MAPHLDSRKSAVWRFDGPLTFLSVFRLQELVKALGADPRALRDPALEVRFESRWTVGGALQFDSQVL